MQAYSNEPTLPPAAQILRFLNIGVEEVERRLNGIFLWAPYPTVVGQTYLQLNNDVQYIDSANFSSGASNTSGFITSSSPLSQGTLVYPMFPLEQASFMDSAAGFPAVGFGPPQAWFTYTDQGYAPTTTLPTPGTPSLSPISGPSNGLTLSVEQTYVSTAGETTPSAAASQAITTAQQGLALSPQGVSNATGYNTYVSVSGGNYYKQNASPTPLGTPFTIPGTPAVTGTQPPVTNTATGSGQGGSMFMQLYPAAMIGQVNIYYKARPQLWADTTVNSWTNLDTSAQEAVVLFAVRRVLAIRGRSAEADRIWKPEYESLIESMVESLARRTRPKSGRVRDVTNRSFPSTPFWMT